MRILFVLENGNLKGGTEILAFRLADALTEKGVDCAIFSAVPWADDMPTKFTKTGLSAIEYSQLEKIRNNPFNKLSRHHFADRFLSKKIADTAKTLGADWIVNHEYNLAAAIPTDIAGIRTIQVIHWSIEGYEQSLFRLAQSGNLLLSRLKSLALRLSFDRLHKALLRFSKIVVLTDAAVSEVSRILCLNNTESIHVIPNSIPMTEQSNVISSLDCRRVVFVGRLSREKGVIRLLRIWENISREIPSLVLDIYGEGSAREEMDRFIAERGLRNIEFHGFCADLKAIYSDSSLLLMTSDSEGFGLVLIEAMYFGVPCISFDCPVSPAEIISDAGVIVPCFDEHKYASVVVGLLSNPNQLKELQRRSIQRASDFYQLKVTNRWINLLNQE